MEFSSPKDPILFSFVTERPRSTRTSFSYLSAPLLVDYECQPSIRDNYNLTFTSVSPQLSVTVGLTWTTGFIIPYTGVPELGYLFIILNSLQGPVIFLSFTCSRRVIELWRGKFGGSLSSTKSKGTAVSTVSSGKTTQSEIAMNARDGDPEINNV